MARQWKTLAVVVEVKVPTTCPATAKDLAWAVRDKLPPQLLLPRPLHPRAQWGAARVMQFERYWRPLARLAGWRAPMMVRVPVDEVSNG